MKCRLDFVLLVVLVGAAACAEDEPRRVALRPGFGQELSGIGKVRGGLLVAEDELVGSLLLVTGLETGAARMDLVKLERRRRESRPHTRHPKLFAIQDVEDVAVDGDVVYVLGSHHGRLRDGRWERRLDREFILRAHWDARQRELRVRLPDARKRKSKRKRGVYTGLLAHLEATEGKRVTTGLNAEGLAVENKRIYIGLRNPLSRKGKALVFRTKRSNLFSVEKSEGFRGDFERLELDLAGGGVRGLFWDEASARLLVLSGPRVDRDRAPVALWAYDLERESLERIHTFRGGAGVPEGVCRLNAEELVVALDAERAPRAELVRVRWKR